MKRKPSKIYDNEPRKKIGEIVKTKDGGIGYFIDLDDSYFLNSYYDFKLIKPTDDVVECLVQDLATTIGLSEGTLTSWNVEHAEDYKRIKSQITQLLLEDF